MEKKELCSSCAYLKTCIFSKNPPIWQCEEFSNGNNVVKRFRRQEKRVIREKLTESK